ncbi:hypothetical protein HY496_01610 [Candidatus Woesearchaeota archaeon]|nr:hypothetical protein [Candidatus Woesearchaeota archaeon]
MALWRKKYFLKILFEKLGKGKKISPEYLKKLYLVLFSQENVFFGKLALSIFDVPNKTATPERFNLPFLKKEIQNIKEKKA